MFNFIISYKAKIVICSYREWLSIFPYVIVINSSYFCSQYSDLIDRPNQVFSFLETFQFHGAGPSFYARILSVRIMSVSCLNV